MWLRHGHVVFKSSIFVVQKATAPKDGVEFRQGSIGIIRSSLAMLYDVWRRRQFSTNQRPRNYLTLTDSESTYCQALLYDQRLQKWKNEVKFFQKKKEVNVLFRIQDFFWTASWIKKTTALFCPIQHGVRWSHVEGSFWGAYWNKVFWY